MDGSIREGRSSLGRSGEAATLDVYLRRGFRSIARNWRCALGELDLVVERDGLLVFCEVKTRSGASFGGGYEAVTWTKRRKLRQLGMTTEVEVFESLMPEDKLAMVERNRRAYHANFQVALASQKIRRGRVLITTCR